MMLIQSNGLRGAKYSWIHEYHCTTAGLHTRLGRTKPLQISTFLSKATRTLKHGFEDWNWIVPPVLNRICLSPSLSFALTVRASEVTKQGTIGHYSCHITNLGIWSSGSLGHAYLGHRCDVKTRRIHSKFDNRHNDRRGDHCPGWKFVQQVFTLICTVLEYKQLTLLWHSGLPTLAHGTYHPNFHFHISPLDQAKVLPITITADLIANTYSHVSDLRRKSQVVVVQSNTPPAAPQSDTIILLAVESPVYLNTKDSYPEFREADF